MSIKIVTYEITDKCNARCPQCMRTNPNGCVPANFINNKDITIDQFKKLAPSNFLKKLEVVDFNCPKGDPASHSDIFSILDYITNVNDSLEIHFPTNGSLRDVTFWKKLATYPQLKIIFALDGTDQQTHEFYRRNTNFEKILANASAFISSGGNAEWQFIIFDHNKHQVKEAKSMANSLGFKSFNSIISNRFNNKEEFKYSYNSLQHKLIPVSKQDRSNLPINSIDCRYLKNKHLFVDINGYAMSCCFHAGSLFAKLHIKDNGKFNNFLDVSFDDYNLDEFNIFTVGFDSAFSAYKKYMEDLKVQWQQLNPSMCKVVCGKC